MMPLQSKTTAPAYSVTAPKHLTIHRRSLRFSVRSTQTVIPRSLQLKRNVWNQLSVG